MDVEMQETRRDEPEIKPVVLEWRNVSCTYTMRKGFKKVERQVLHSVSGFAEPGELVAVMGSSGSGKSSLFDILTMRKQHSTSSYHVEGHVLMNGLVADPELFRAYGASVLQQDLMYPTLSPLETLNYTADLQPDSFAFHEGREERVRQMLSDLRLGSCKNTRIGDAHTRGISGGERKRTSIGKELISAPSILFLDEPISGLDSYTALKLMQLLQQRTQKGQTVFITVHQPSREVFQLFDKLILLSQGTTIYNGPASDAVRYFTYLGYRCPLAVNPADYFLRTLQSKTGAHLTVLAENYKASIMARKRPSENETLPFLTRKRKTGQARKKKQFTVLFKRGLIHYFRETALVHIRIVELCFVSLFLGFLYFQVGANQASVTSRKGALFNILMSNFMSSIIATLVTFPGELQIVKREVTNQLYSPFVYITAKLASEMAFNTTYPVVFSFAVYWLVGFQPHVEQFVFFVLTNILLVYVAQFIGLTLSCLVQRPESARSLVPFTIIPFALVCGVFIFASEIPIYLQWMRWVSPFRYGYEAYLINEFTGLELHCDTSEFVTSDGTSVCPFNTGEDVLLQMGLHNTSFGFETGMICALLGAWSVVFLLAFRARIA